jgi:hypothetical protein
MLDANVPLKKLKLKKYLYLKITTQNLFLQCEIQNLMHNNEKVFKKFYH